MGIARGTNIIRDGLVFGYDSGYGVSDNNTTTRFYPGKNTVNYLSSGVSGYNVVQGSAWHGATPTFTLGTSEFGTPIGTYTIGSTSYMYSYDQVLDDDLSTLSSKNVTFSIYLKRRVAGNARIRIYDNISGYTSLSQSLTTEFQRYTVNKTLGASPTRIFVMIDNTGGGIIDFHSPQLEVGVASPFVDGTRSATNSLIDLKKTTNIDVSNISFDSTGQPSWDGTDDKIVIPADSFSNIGTDDFTIDLVFKNTKTSNYSHFFSVKDQYHFALKMPNTGDRNIYVYRSSALSTYTAISAYAPSSTDYYHLVCKREGDNLELYLNGVSKGTKSGWGSIDIQNDTEATSIGTHGTTSEFLGGELPVMKLYNRALTAAEVLQNYKAYKNRFNI